MTTPPGSNEVSTKVVHRYVLESAPVDPSIEPNQRRGFFRAVGVFLGLCRDYSAQDIARLKEAGVRIVEAKADAAAAEAKRMFAEAEEVRQRAAALAAQTNRATREDDIRYARDLADALARLAAEMDRIRQRGGSVSFYEEQLQQLCREGETEFPSEPPARPPSPHP